MKLGSLFDGSGGFPLAGVLNGITPVWASEIEPYPIAVTSARLPSMKHLGSITEINGGNIESVDIITFGSPCQDLSIAGNQKGIENGARSSLFFQAIRIIKEMREATHGEYPRFAVWENVPGAFSSNKGNDFRLVLEALASVSEPEVSIPLPEKGKWQRAGEIVGDGYSIAWRTLDAQFWGVPQRRKRIYLVADFRGERAGQILFEQEGSSRNPAEGREAGEGVTDDAERSVGGSCAFQLCGDRDAPSVSWSDIAYCVPANPMSDRGQAVCYSPIESCGFGETGIGYWQAGIQCLRAEGENRPSRPSNVLVYPQVARTLEARHDSSPCIDRGQNIITPQANGIARADTAGCNGKGWGENVGYTLTRADRHGVVYSLGGFANYRPANPMLRASGGDNGGGSEAIVVLPTVTGTLCASGAGTQRPAGQANEADMCVVFSRQRCGTGGNNTPAVCYAVDGYNQSTSETAGTIRAGKSDQDHVGAICYPIDDMLVAGLSPKPPRKYIVRRLTPTECARLQGFPDTWGDVLVKGKPHSESAEYKMWGNGIALPCAVFVLGRIAGQIERSEPNG